MKDEEMAEEYLQSIEGDDCVIITDREERKQAFLAGLKAGRPQWHYLTQNPNDLPKKNGEYFCKVNSRWEKYGVKHFTLQPYGYNRQWEGQGYSVIAWCEIPTFDKE